MGGGTGGDDVDHGRDDAADGPNDDEDLASWPGLESLPPSPPFEYPPARPFRRRRPPEPVPAPIAGPGAVPTGVASVDGPAAPVRPRSRGPLIAALVAVVALLLVVPALVVLGRDDAEQEEAAAATTTTTKAPTSTTTGDSTTTTSTSTTSTTSPPPPLPPMVMTPDPPLDAAIAEVSAFVTENRGLAFAAPVPGVRLPVDEFRARVREQAVDRLPAIEAQGAMLKLQGIIPADTDYVEEYLSTYPTLVGAYYDTEAKRMVAPGEPGTPVSSDLQVTLAHELTHALDDQEFAFSTRVYDDPNTEQQFGLQVLVEGDAERIEHLWAKAHGIRPSRVTPDSADGIVTAQFQVVYALGEDLVDDIVARGGLADLNVAFDDPPSTSEQILHPEKYAVRESPIPMDAPEPDGSPVWEGVTGEYTTGLMLGAVMDPDYADQAAAGWGNDRGVMWVESPSDGGLTCLRIAYVMDTPADLDELDYAFAAWSYEAPDRYVYREDDALIVTSCAPIPPPPSEGSPL